MKLPLNYFGYIFALLGILLIAAAIFNWSWLMNSSNNGLLNWLKETLGEKIVRIFYAAMGVIIVLLAVAFIYFY